MTLTFYINPFVWYPFASGRIDSMLSLTKTGYTTRLYYITFAGIMITLNYERRLSA